MKNSKIVLLAAISNKKQQQETIDQIKTDLDIYNNIINDIKQHDEYGRV